MGSGWRKSAKIYLIKVEDEVQFANVLESSVQGLYKDLYNEIAEC